MSTTPSLLDQLAPALRDLHQALLEETRAEYEREHGPVGAGQLLRLLIQDPSFAWLRALSAPMADLDQLLEEEHPATEEEAAAIRQELEEVFSPSSSPPFWSRCAPLLQSPAVVMAYGRVKGILARLPPPPAPDNAARLHAQHRWAVARRKRGAV